MWPLQGKGGEAPEDHLSIIEEALVSLMWNYSPNPAIPWGWLRLRCPQGFVCHPHPRAAQITRQCLNWEGFSQVESLFILSAANQLKCLGSFFCSASVFVSFIWNFKEDFGWFFSSHKYSFSLFKWCFFRALHPSVASMEVAGVIWKIN